MKLYEISELYHDFLYALDNGEIEDEQAIADTLDSIEGLFSDKVDNIANIIQQEQAIAETWEQKAKDISQRAKAKKAHAEWLKGYLAKYMLGLQVKKFESVTNKITFRKSEAVQLADKARFVEYAQANGLNDLLTYKAPEPSLTAIKAAIKAGVNVEGAQLIEKQNIQIYTGKDK